MHTKKQGIPIGQRSWCEQWNSRRLERKSRKPHVWCRISRPSWPRNQSWYFLPQCLPSCPHYGPQIGHSLAAYMDFESFNFAISSHARVIRMWFWWDVGLGFSAEQNETAYNLSRRATEVGTVLMTVILKEFQHCFPTPLSLSSSSHLPLTIQAYYMWLAWDWKRFT